MRLSRLGLVLVLLSSARGAFAQVPTAPAPQPAPPAGAPIPKPTEPPPAPVPPPPAEVVEPPPPEVVEPPPPVEPTPPPVAEPAPTPAPATTPEPTPPPPASLPLDAAGTVAVPPSSKPKEAEPPPWPRAHSPLTLEVRLGFLIRPDSSAGFDHESNVGAEVGFSLYMELKRELAAGLEIERSSLGRGTASNGLDSVHVDYTVSSAMLGLRVYPKRTELLDVFVGLQVGLGIQGVSASGTANNGPLSPPSPYTCGASDTPAFQIGGGIGARLMLTPRWGLTARLNGTGRRLTGEMVENCAQGLGTATTVSAGLGIGYDFDLDP